MGEKTGQDMRRVLRETRQYQRKTGGEEWAGGQPKLEVEFYRIFNNIKSNLCFIQISV